MGPFERKDRSGEETKCNTIRHFATTMTEAKAAAEVEGGGGWGGLKDPLNVEN